MGCGITLFRTSITSFHIRQTSFHIPFSYLLPLFLCLLSFFLSSSLVFRGNTPARIPHFLCHSEWNFLFDLSCILTSRFASFHTDASLLTFFSFFILYHFCCSHALVFGKTLMHAFHISYSHTEWYLFFSDCITTSAHFAFEAKSINICALVNLYV